MTKALSCLFVLLSLFAEVKDVVRNFQLDLAVPDLFSMRDACASCAVNVNGKLELVY